MSEILQCEKSYEITLRRIASYKTEIPVNAMNANNQSAKSQQDKALNKQLM